MSVYLSIYYCYLSDDLAIFSVDLSDASPLRQEGEDLIKLQEKDTETAKITVAPLLYLNKSCLAVYTRTGRSCLTRVRSHP